MDQIIVKSGKGEINLQKSRSLVGLKTDEGPDKLRDKDYVAEELHTNLGGFQIVKLNKNSETIDEKLDEVRTRDEVQLGTHVYYAEGGNRPMVPTGYLYITFQDGVSEEEQQTVLGEYFLELRERRTPVQVLAQVTAQSPNPVKTCYFLQQLSLVKTAEPDLDMPLDEYDFVGPTDDLLPNEWHLENNGFVVDANFRLKKGADAKVVDAWRRLGNLGSSQITIAIIDNGFDLAHPDLKDKVYKPWDLWNNTSTVLQGDARYTHGTPCASIAVAATNGRGIVGAAPGARFMPIHGTSYSVKTTEDMFDYCIRNGADVISCSWGTTDSRYSLSPVKEQALARAARQGRNGKGCVIVFAVGNDDLDYVNFYAAHPDVIAVAASTSQDSYATYSNRGREVSVCAPSNGDWPIIAARAWWDAGLENEVGNYKYWRDGRSRGDYYKHFGGTSSSTPLVAGICALVLSANPNLTAGEVKDILQKTADKIGSPSEYTNGHSPRYGYGRVNADRAVAEALRRKEQGAPVQPEVQENISSGQGLFRFDVTKQEPKGWGVQIGAFYDYGNVLIQTEKLQSLFKVPIIVNINELNGKTIYKVVIGNFADAQPARDLMDRVKAAGYSPFLRNLADFG